MMEHQLAEDVNTNIHILTHQLANNTLQEDATEQMMGRPPWAVSMYFDCGLVCNDHASTV